MQLPRDVNRNNSPPTFLLVHGTWAAKAPWTQPQGALYRRLLSEFSEAKVVAIDWSGSNRFADRLEAAKTIGRVAQEHLQQGERVFLVGHSHGGSAIAYALQRSQELSESISGALFLGTPFLAMDVRRGYRTLYRAIVILLVAAMFLGGGIAAGYLIPSGSWSGPVWREYLALGVSAVLLLGCGVVLAKTVTSQRVDRYWTKVQQTARQWDTTRLADAPMLFLRTTGDEVAMVMGFLQLLCFISNGISSVAAWMAEKIGSLFGWFWRRRWGRGFLIVVGVVAVVGVTFAGVMGKLFGFPLANGLDAINPFSDGWGVDQWRFGVGSSLELVYRCVIAAIDVLVIGLLLTALLLAMGLFMATVSSTITLYAFGRFDPLGALALEMAAEPTPRGERAFVHLPWEDRLKTREQNSFGLRHSEPYSEPMALDVVCAWVRGEFASAEERARNWKPSNS